MRNRRTILLFLVLLSLAAYFNTIHAPFLSDDIPTIVDNPHSVHILSYWNNPHELSNAMIWHISRLDLPLYHISSIAVHALNSCLVFFLLGIFFAATPSLVGAALFAVHPIHTEAVSWISGRPYLFLSFAALAVLLLYIRATESKKLNRLLYLSGLGIYAYFNYAHYGFLTFLPAVLALYDFTRSRVRQYYLFWLPFVAIAGLRILVALPDIHSHMGSMALASEQNLGLRNPFIYFGFSFFSNLWLLLWPVHLTFYHGPLGLITPTVVVNSLLTVGLLILAVFLYRNAKILFFALGMYALMLAPTYSPKAICSVIAERYLYLPSLLCSIAVAFLYQQACRQKAYRRAALALCVLIIALALVRTIVRNEDYHSAHAFWQATVQASPRSARSHRAIGAVYLEEGNIAGAMVEFDIARRLNPGLRGIYNDLGGAYERINWDVEAIAMFEKELTRKPPDAQVYYNLANVYVKQGELGKAVIFYQKAIALNTGYVHAYNNLGALYERKGDYVGARHYYEEALRYSPDNPVVLHNLANVLSHLNIRHE